VQISEGQRIQSADAAGRSYKFEAQESRDKSKLDFLRGQTKQAKQREYGAQEAKSEAMGSAVGSIGNSLMGKGKNFFK